MKTFYKIESTVEGPVTQWSTHPQTELYTNSLKANGDLGALRARLPGLRFRLVEVKPVTFIDGRRQKSVPVPPKEQIGDSPRLRALVEAEQRIRPNHLRSVPPRPLDKGALAAEMWLAGRALNAVDKAVGNPYIPHHWYANALIKMDAEFQRQRQSTEHDLKEAA